MLNIHIFSPFCFEVTIKTYYLCSVLLMWYTNKQEFHAEVTSPMSGRKRYRLSSVISPKQAFSTSKSTCPTSIDRRAPRRQTDVPHVGLEVVEGRKCFLA